MAEFTITLGQIFYLVGLAVAVLLIMTLYKAYEILKQIREFLIKNDANINQSMESFPKVIQNVEEITKGLKDEMKHVGGTVRNLEEITGTMNEEVKHLKGTVRNIEETVEYAAATAQNFTDDIVGPINDILSIISLIRSLFVKEKKKGLFGK